MMRNTQVMRHCSSHQVNFAAENVSELAVVQLVGRVVANDDGRRRRRHGLVVAALLAEGGVRRSVPAVEEEEAAGEEAARPQVFFDEFHAPSEPQTLTVRCHTCDTVQDG